LKGAFDARQANGLEKFATLRLVKFVKEDIRRGKRWSGWL